MDTPYRVEPAAYNGSYRSHTFNIVTSRDGVLCSTPDQVFAHKLVDLLNADANRRCPRCFGPMPCSTHPA